MKPFTYTTLFSAMITAGLIGCAQQEQAAQSNQKNQTDEQQLEQQVILKKPQAEIDISSGEQQREQRQAEAEQFADIAQPPVRLAEPQPLPASAEVAQQNAVSTRLVKDSMRVSPAVADAYHAPTEQLVDRENYQQLEANPVQLVSENPVSTFSIDVDTASYANVRRMLNQGRLPWKDAVRTEEMINYFAYPSYPQPDADGHPFSVHTEVARSPWNANTHLMMVGLQGYQVQDTELPPSNLVFLVDVSGSMTSTDKLPLLQRSLRMLTQTLTDKDTVSIVTYAGNAGVVLEPTSGDQKAKILAAIDNMRAGGSTHGSAGIKLAYQLAEQHRIEDGVNRVIIGSDGDMNVGTVSIEALKDLIARKREKGISLTTLGFGTGNYNDHLMEQLADIGNGNSAYIDTLSEARRVLVENRGGTLLTIAKDVKIQVEFSPAVKEYRLIGYENRMLNREDFNNDKVDAGEIGAGHSVTALYELTLADQPGKVDPLRYRDQADEKKLTATDHSELAYIKLRYKKPDQQRSRLLSQPVMKASIVDFQQASLDFKWASAVAAFAEQLKGGEHLGEFGYDEILKLAISARGQDLMGYRSEMTQLVRMARQVAQ